MKLPHSKENHENGKMMYANLCPEVIGISGLKAENLIDLAARQGFGGVDFPLGLIQDVDEARGLRDRLIEKGLEWGLFWLPSDFPGADDKSAAEGFEKLGEILPIIQAAGVTRTYNHLWPSSDTREFDENFAWHVKRLQPIARVLADHGVSYGLEFIGPRHLRMEKKYPFVHTLKQALSLADAVGHGAGVVIDSFHWYTSGGTVDETRILLQQVGGTRVINVHVNDAVPGRSPDEQIDGNRMLPMASGLIDLKGLIGLLKEAAYTGPVTVEPFEPTRSRLSRLNPEEAAAEVSAILRKLLGTYSVTSL